VNERRLGSLLSLVRQGVTLGLDFGAHSLETMVAIAETVEDSVYEAGSLVVRPGSIGFALANPPLRTGAFSAIRVLLNGAPVPGARTRLRPGAGSPWRTADSLSTSAPWALRPGDRTEFELDVNTVATDRPLTVRLEFECIAIPPLVWIEFTETPAGEAL
jgi:hypothetical protein